MPKVALHTLGCKLNYAETSTIGKQFLERGFELEEFGGAADVVVINTCTVTERADRECRQIIRRAVRTSNAPFVIVTGCYAQLEPEAVASINGVDLVLGAKEKFDLFSHVGSFTKHAVPQVRVSDIDQVNDFGPAATNVAGGRTRAFLKIQDGCDFTCTFCTIPLARGGSRSQDVATTVAQARDLVDKGFKEVVLTGVNVGDYGKQNGASLIDLLRALPAVEGLERVRISSIEPNLLSDALIDLVAAETKLCPHFHVPLQSGSDAVLRRMRRRYTTAGYRRVIDRVRATIPDAGIGIDVIVGFPGESDDDFTTTLEFLTEVPATYLHVFTYSERLNTPAVGMSAPVPPSVRHERNTVLRTLGAKKKRAFYESMVGRTSLVLAEGEVEGETRFGFTGNYVRVALPGEACRENQIVPVKILGIQDEVCTGVISGGGRQ